MLSDYADNFSRDVSGTPEDWLARLPEAIGPHRWQRIDNSVVLVHLDERSPARLILRWEVQSPRRIALMSLPRLRVDFHFTDFDQPQIRRFMQRFDLHMQRGGG